MAKYVCLLRFTDKGARAIKESTSRAQAFAEAAETVGVTVELQYWLFGAYDGLLVVDAENEEKALHWLTELATAGNIRTETMQAFEESQFKAICEMR